MATALPTAIAAALALVGIAVLLARPTRRAHALTGILLVLWAAVTFVFPRIAAAPSEGEALLYARLTVWYSIPFPLVALALARDTDAARTRLTRVALWAGAAATIAFGIAYALRPTLVLEGVAPVGQTWTMTSGPLLYTLAVVSAASQAVVVACCARRAEEEPQRAARLRVVWIGAALLLPLAHSAAFFAGTLAVDARRWALAEGMFLFRALGTILAFALALPFAIRLLRQLGGMPRRAVGAGALLVALLGIADALVVADERLLAWLPGYVLSSAFVRFPVALALGVAALRYGLADLGRSDRARIQGLVAACAMLILATIAGGAAILLLGANLVGFGVALAAAPAAPWLARDPLRRASQAVTRRALLPPDDPAAIAQRAHTYAAAISAATGADGRILPGGEALLAQLREDLGITEREHELLVRGIESRASPEDPLALGGYRLEREIGRGATGSVHLAREIATGREVVVKRFSGARDPALALREARAMGAVQHERLVRMLHVDRRGDDVFLVMERAEGGSARDLLEREGPLAPPRAVAIALDVLDALEALHAHGLVHRDVKAENVLLDAGGRALLGDLGSAQESRVDLTRTSHGADGSSLSTVAPEVLRGAKPDARADVYAAGAVLYRLLTGAHYVDLEGKSAFEATQRILLDAPRLEDSRVPPTLRPVLARALAKKPEERFASARDMRAALASAPL